MEPSAIGAGPVTALVFVLGLVVAWVGHALGKTSERKRKETALAEAERTSKALLDEARRESEEKLEVLSKASANDLTQLKDAHAQQLDQINRAHQTMVDSVKKNHATEIERLNAEYSGLVDRLNAANNANMKALEERREQEIHDLRAHNAAAVASLKNEHQGAINELASERDRLRATKDDLQHTVTELHHEIKENRMNNVFSVSKSGEKLMRVVRSVQELATELDETSRAVTGGEYSIFDAIKDQRDRETVRRLAGSDEQVESEESAAAKGTTDAGDDAAADAPAKERNVAT